MSIEAKVTPEGANAVIGSASNQVITNGTLTLAESSNVALNIHPAMVSSYSKEGTDLTLILKSGETIKIINFYPENAPASHLFLVNDEDKLIAVDFPATASDGPLVASYTPQNNSAGFLSLTESEGKESTPGAMAALLGIAAVGGGIAIADHHSGSSDSDNSASPPPSEDSTPPEAVSDLKIASDGSSISGKAEPGATVGIDTNGDGQADVTVIAAPDGSFNAPLTPPLTNGQTVGVTVTDPAGNTSPVISTQAPDTTPPDPAGDLQIAPDGSSISGKAEPGATVGIDTNGDGQADITVIAAPDGSFHAPLTPPLNNGQTVGITVTDPAGNTSAVVTTAAPDTTSPEAATNLQITSEGTSISGNAEPGASVGIDTNGDGKADITVIAAPDGSFNASLNPPLTNGQTVGVTVTDPAGNTSPETTIQAPDFVEIPLIHPTNGTTISGSAEAGTTIILTDGENNPIGQTTTDVNGNWTFTPTAPLPNETVIVAIAQDGAGKNSAPATITVDAIAPESPSIDPSSGTTLSGTAEAGSTLILTDGNGHSLGQTTADADGNWSFTPAT
ncbi:BapA prefix-like domain-containing protein, partial [Enterobacteriaceae bacterium RIT693]|nr:BapA prefix-like domain-containing protein [Enterobacteriaceae bacterium RIT693]